MNLFPQAMCGHRYYRTDSLHDLLVTGCYYLNITILPSSSSLSELYMARVDYSLVDASRGKYNPQQQQQLLLLQTYSEN